MRAADRRARELPCAPHIDVGAASVDAYAGLRFEFVAGAMVGGWSRRARRGRCRLANERSLERIANPRRDERGDGAGECDVEIGWNHAGEKSRAR